MKKVMIVSGEASGDVHGSNLVKAMLDKDPQLSFFGMGGKDLQASGVNILFEAHKVAVIGIAEIFSHLPDILTALKTLKTFIKQERPSLLIIIDFADFNLNLAAYAKKMGVPVFYYITPKVWAWRSGRVKTIRERTDTLGVILPFEEDYFMERGVEAKYVGHPLLDSVSPQYGKQEFYEKYNLSSDTVLVGLIPGSRDKEVRFLLPTFFEAARIIKKSSNKKVCFLLPQASTITENQLNESGLAEFIKEGHEIVRVEDDQHEAMSACDVVVAASGTVTLELALLDVPMVVVYRVSPITYFLGSRLVKLEHFSLVNLVAKKECVVELLQDEVTPENISSEMLLILNDKERNRQMRKDLADVRLKMGEAGASANAAELAFKLL